MKNSIIKSYSTWLNEALRVHEAEGSDPSAMYQAKDRKGLVALAQTNDSAEIKAHPAYASVMEWWKNGSGDMGLIKSIIKSGSARKTDTARSLKSIYYWSGAGSSDRASTYLSNFYKVSDSIVRNGERLGLDQAKLSGLSEVIQKLKELQAKGFVPNTKIVLGTFIPGALTDNKYTDQKISDIATELDKPAPNERILRLLKMWRVAYYSREELGQDPKSSMDFLEKARLDPAQVNNYWAASTQLNDENKKALLDQFQKRADAYVARKQKAGVQIDMPKAILAATDLYIAPKNEKITVTVDTTVAQPAAAPIVFSYPADPKGNENSPEFQKGKNMFPDDGVTLTPTAITEMNAAVKEAVDAIKATGATIKSITTWGYASTSQVNSQYKSPNGKTGNAGLADDRLAAINKGLADALKAVGVTVVPTIDAAQNKPDPNRGPAWTTKEMNDPKFGKPGARTQEYEDNYASWRFSIGFISFICEIPQEPQRTVAATATPSGEWNNYIGWDDESISISLPPLKIRFPGIPKTPATGGRLKCPTFN
jgi:hypothetical protein